MTKLYLDTEFNGMGGELISLALVDPARGDASERSFYGVVNIDGPIDRWVQDNVMHALWCEREPRSHCRVAYPMIVLQTRLKYWLKPYDAVTIIADWPDDIAYFCRALITGPGTRIDTPHLTFEIRRDLNSEGSAVPHNALEDARAIARMAAEIDGSAA